MSNSFGHFEVLAIDRPSFVVEEIIKSDGKSEPGRHCYRPAIIVTDAEPFGICYPHMFDKLTISMRGEVWAFYNAVLGLLKSDSKEHRTYSVLYERVEQVKQPSPSQTDSPRPRQHSHSEYFSDLEDTSPEARRDS